jgi:hypothetical protein
MIREMEVGFCHARASPPPFLPRNPLRSDRPAIPPILKFALRSKKF